MSGQIVIETVSDKEEGTRLDRWVKRRVQMTQGQVEKMLRTGQIRVDGGRAKANTRLEAGQEVRLPILDAVTDAPAKPRKKASGKDKAFLKSMILYEDDDMLAINKPAGMAVQGGSKQDVHIDGMLPALSDGEFRPVLVHRLDKDTSGVLLLAKHPKAAARLGELFRGREMDKVYWAVTVGVPNPPFGQIRCWMAKGVPDDREESGWRVIDPKAGGGRRRDADRERMIRSGQGVPGARHSITDYAVISMAAQRAAWVALKPLTGRMHQLRFHMLEMNTSILGDHKYQSRREVPQGLAPGLHLHARALIIPRENAGPITVTAPIPDHMRQTFETLGFLEQEAGKNPLAPFV